MKKLLSFVLAALLLLLPAGCAAEIPETPDSPVLCAVSQVGAPTLDAFAALGFEDPEAHVGDGEVQFYLSVPEGVTLCGEAGTAMIFHSAPDNASVLDNPETSAIQFVFAFDDPTAENYAFTLELFKALRDELGEPEAPTAYLSFSEVTADDLAGSAPGEPAARNVWLQDDVQVTLTGRAIAAEDNQPSGKPCWYVLVDFSPHNGASA